jgi:hypothetical protein
MPDDLQQQVRAIAAQVARKEVFWHEVRFTAFGAITALLACLAWLWP